MCDEINALEGLFMFLAGLGMIFCFGVAVFLFVQIVKSYIVQ